MRIAFITHRFPHLANTFILNEITQILRLGHEVDVYSLDPSVDTVINSDVAAYRLMERTRYFLDYVAEDPANEISFRSYVGDKLNEHVHAFPTIGKELLSNGTQIIHAAFGNRPCTAALALSEYTGLPFTFESHARDLFVEFALSKEKIDKARFVFTISEYNKRYFMEEHGCPEEKLVLRRVSIVQEYCDQILENAKKDNLLVTVARLHPIKGIPYALQAMVKVRESHPNVRLHVIGEGELAGALNNQAAELGLQECVVFHGPLKNKEALSYVAKASAFILPSVICESGDRDGIPTALIESMYLRTPPVSTFVSGIPELVEDGINGLLVEPGDVDGLAKKIRFLLDHPDRREEMGRRGREKVAAEFDSVRNTQKVLDAWKSLV